MCHQNIRNKNNVIQNQSQRVHLLSGMMSDIQDMVGNVRYAQQTTGKLSDSPSSRPADDLNSKD